MDKTVATTQNAFDETRLMLVANGYHPHPIGPGSKKPMVIVDGEYREIVQWQSPDRGMAPSPQPGAGVGVRLGLQRGGAYLVALDWDDDDLALGLARTYRWGGHSAWELPLSVAQHSLTVLALRRIMEPQLSYAEALRELLHDAEEGFLSWDPIAPLKPHLGEQFHSLVSKLERVIAKRYGLQPWTAEAYAAHKHADRLAAASEAFHVVGWSLVEIRDHLGIEL